LIIKYYERLETSGNWALVCFLRMAEVVKGCMMPALSRRPVRLPEDSTGMRLATLNKTRHHYPLVMIATVSVALLLSAPALQFDDRTGTQ
jgi:hypothetical protein